MPATAGTPAKAGTPATAGAASNIIGMLSRNLNSSKKVNDRGSTISETIKTSKLPNAIAAKPATKLKESTAGSPATHDFWADILAEVKKKTYLEFV
jgi:hypothetical protein